MAGSFRRLRFFGLVKYASHLPILSSGLPAAVAFGQLCVECYSPRSLRSSFSQLLAALRPLAVFGSPNFVLFSYTPISGLARIWGHFGFFFPNCHYLRLSSWLVVSLTCELTHHYKSIPVFLLGFTHK